jgi:hypothetical protein
MAIKNKVSPLLWGYKIKREWGGENEFLFV